MKRILVTILMAAMCACAVLAAGCSSTPSPSEVTAAALDAMKAQDTETLQSFYSGEVTDVDPGKMAEGYTGDDAEAVNAFAEKLLDFDYEVGDETIDGDKATVEVSITTYDFGTAFEDAVGLYIKQGFAAALSGASQEELSKMFSAALLDKVNALEEKEYTSTTTFNLTKQDGEWKLDELSKENQDSLLGGIISKVDSLNRSLNGNTSAS